MKEEGWSLNDIFREIDGQRQGFIVDSDIEKMLSLHEGRVKRTKLRQVVDLLIRKYDKNQNKKITYLEFIDELTPKNF